MSMLELAQSYAMRGWAVFPLHTPSGNAERPCSCRKPACPNIGKHPRTLNGLRDATTDAEQITKWWEMWPEANIGLATGAGLGAIVLDVDPKSGGIETLKAYAERFGFPNDRVVVRTGSGGFHYFFAHPGGVVANTQGSADRSSFLGAGLDLRGDGGYVVAAGSLHQSGNRYEWQIERNGHWPVLPEWLGRKIAERKPVSVALSPSDEDQLQAGARHPQLLRWAGQMRRSGMSQGAILAALRAENSTRCNPPKGDAELVSMARWIAAKPPEEAAIVARGDALTSDEAEHALHTVEQYETALDALYDKGFQPGLHPGWDSLAEIWTIEPGHPTLITGCPTAGKSTFVNAWLNHMALAYDWRVAYCSPEFCPTEYHILRFIEAYTGESAHGSVRDSKMSRDTYEAGKRWAKEHMVFIAPDSKKQRRVKLALDCALRQQERGGCNAVVLDPWAAFFHEKRQGERADESLANQLNEIVEFGLQTKITPVIVLHPHMMLPDKDGKYPVVKPYDLNGGAMWYNLFYNLLSLHREPTWENGQVELYVWKVKYHWLGKQGSRKLYYKPETGRYTEQPSGESRPWYHRNNKQSYGMPEF